MLKKISGARSVALLFQFEAAHISKKTAVYF